MEKQEMDVFARALKVLYEGRAAELGFPGAEIVIRKREPDEKDAPPGEGPRQGSRPLTA